MYNTVIINNILFQNCNFNPQNTSKDRSTFSVKKKKTIIKF